jgi:hypothetical protein
MEIRFLPSQFVGQTTFKTNSEVMVGASLLRKRDQEPFDATV